MSAFPLRSPSPRRSPTHAALDHLGSLVRGLAAEWKVRRAIAAARGFDDAMLHDIGMDRGAIEDAVRHGRSG